MNILITGAKGFAGRNLTASLRNIREGKDKTYPELSIKELFLQDIDMDPALLQTYCSQADFVFHFGSILRALTVEGPKLQSEFMTGNSGFTSTLLDTLKKYDNTCPVMISSSTQAVLDNPYGQSQKAGEELMFAYAKEMGARVLVNRFPNIFGKWYRPNYNSAVAAFCNNIANDLFISVGYGLNKGIYEN